MAENRKGAKSFLNLFNYLVVPFVCCLVSLYVAFWNQREEYNLMFILPLCFLVCYELLLKKCFNNFKFFSVSYSIVSAIRYVITPLLIVLGGRYDGRSASSPVGGSFVLAFLLMIFELAICSLLIWFLNRKLSKNKSEKSEKLVFPTSWTVYVIFIIIVLALALLRPETLKAFSFVRPNESLFNYDDFDVFSQIIILCLNVAKNVFTLLILTFFYKKYAKRKALFWVLASFALISLNSAVYFGTNRFDFILNLVASTIIFCMLYKKYWKVVVVVMAILGCFGFVMISQARDIRGIKGGDNAFYNYADIAQMYFGGPYNVAISIETAVDYPEGRNIKTAIYDVFRSVLGFNMIMKNMENVELSSTYYNRRIFGNSHSSQIIPMIGEGYYLFGVFLAPILDMMFIYIAYLICKSKRMFNIEVGFFFIITLVRLGFINCQSATIQLNDLSFNLFLPLILAFMNGLMGGRRNMKEVEAENEK